MEKTDGFRDAFVKKYFPRAAVEAVYTCDSAGVWYIEAAAGLAGETLTAALVTDIQLGEE